MRRTKEEWSKLLTKDLIRNKSNKELANMFNVKESTIKKWKTILKLSNIRKQEVKSKIDWKEVFEWYNPMIYSSKEIADKIGVSPTAVRKAMVRLNMTRNKLLKKYFTKFRLETYTIEEMAQDLRITPKSVSRLAHRYKKNLKRKKAVKSIKKDRDD